MTKRKQYFGVDENAEDKLLTIEATATGSKKPKVQKHRPGPLEEIPEKAGTEGLGKAIKGKRDKLGNENIYPYHNEDKLGFKKKKATA